MLEGRKEVPEPAICIYKKTHTEFLPKKILQNKWEENDYCSYLNGIFGAFPSRNSNNC